MSTILAGQDGILCHVDYVFIFGKDHGEHDTSFHAALAKTESTGHRVFITDCGIKANLKMAVVK